MSAGEHSAPVVEETATEGRHAKSQRQTNGQGPRHRSDDVKYQRIFRSAECGGREVEYYGERRFVRGFTMVWGRENVSHSISKLLKDRSLYSAGAVHARPAC